MTSASFERNNEIVVSALDNLTYAKFGPCPIRGTSEERLASTSETLQPYMLATKFLPITRIACMEAGGA